MEFLDEALNDYIGAHTTAEPPALHELQRETWLKILYPNMLSGHLQGRFLSFVSKMLRPKVILELGTFTAYSTLCMAEGLPARGILHTIDINEELVKMQQKYVEKVGLQDKVRLHLGNALDIIPKITDPIDLVFIDADKGNYLEYYKLVLPKLAPEGVILADNVLWEGKVASDYSSDDTDALRSFNTFVHQDPRVENLILPLRDGIMMIRKA